MSQVTGWAPEPIWTLEQRNFPCPCRESNADSAVQPVRWGIGMPHILIRIGVQYTGPVDIIKLQMSSDFYEYELYEARQWRVAQGKPDVVTLLRCTMGNQQSASVWGIGCGHDYCRGEQGYRQAQNSCIELITLSTHAGSLTF
jgi:hypothetical protein